MSAQPYHFLLVEDNPGDALLTKEALIAGNIDHVLDVATDGVEALTYLHREGAYVNAARPDLVLLDLNLPGLDGREVLASLKSDPNLRRIPVVVLSSSKAEKDILRSYDLHANCYVVKPPNLQAFFDAIRQIQTFWCTVSELPSV